MTATQSEDAMTNAQPREHGWTYGPGYTTTKPCRDCKFVNILPATDRLSEGFLCRAPQVPKTLSGGSYTANGMRGQETKCGHEGRWWRAR